MNGVRLPPDDHKSTAVLAVHSVNQLTPDPLVLPSLKREALIIGARPGSATSITTKSPEVVRSKVASPGMRVRPPVANPRVDLKES
ncbi:hypothetical protein D3C84_1152110 [compost metagenome]